MALHTRWFADIKLLEVFRHDVANFIEHLVKNKKNEKGEEQRCLGLILDLKKPAKEYKNLNFFSDENGKRFAEFLEKNSSLSINRIIFDLIDRAKLEKLYSLSLPVITTKKISEENLLDFAREQDAQKIIYELLDISKLRPVFYPEITTQANVSLETDPNEQLDFGMDDISVSIFAASKKNICRIIRMILNKKNCLITYE